MTMIMNLIMNLILILILTLTMILIMTLTLIGNRTPRLPGQGRRSPPAPQQRGFFLEQKVRECSATWQSPLDKQGQGWHN
ncbi:MAG: hypothetical protein ACI3VN_09640 [Candidatus Onthomonas sp.]